MPRLRRQGRELYIWNAPFATEKLSGPAFTASLSRRPSRYSQRQTSLTKLKLVPPALKSAGGSIGS
jgi:hypothetical protein